MSIVKTATAHWEGDLKTGKGQISTESGALKANPYGFNTRFEGVAGTNPEELIGAAHAGCYSMALSLILGEAGMKADAIDTKASVTLEKLDSGFTITKIHLDVAIKVTGGDKAAIQECANKAKAGCPVSKVLNAEISMDTKISV
jgi:osmotically inducible protein OsmC